MSFSNCFYFVCAHACTCLSLNLELTYATRLVGLQAPGIYLPWPSYAGITGMPGFFMSILGLKLRFPGLSSKHLTQLSHLLIILFCAFDTRLKSLWMKQQGGAYLPESQELKVIFTYTVNSAIWTKLGYMTLVLCIFFLCKQYFYIKLCTYQLLF